MIALTTLIGHLLARLNFDIAGETLTTTTMWAGVAIATSWLIPFKFISDGYRLLHNMILYQLIKNVSGCIDSEMIQNSA